MAEFDDLRLSKTADLTPPPPPQPQWILYLAGAILLLAFIALWYYLRAGSSMDQPVSGTAEGISQQTSNRPPLGGTVEAMKLPPLDASDTLVRDLIRALSAHPRIAALLTTDQLIRTFTVSVTNIADGDTPGRHLNTIAPEGTFQVRKSSAGGYIDPRSYARFDPHAEAVDSIDAEGAARLYATLRPRIYEAYRELAGANADFDRTLQRAIVSLLETPVVEGDVAVQPGTVGYGYRDSSLESLTRAQQQLLRMGPRNVQIVQQKLRELAGHLGIDASALPAQRRLQAGGAPDV